MSSSHPLPLSLPLLSRAAVRQLDQRAIAEFYLPGLVLMENAGRAAVDILVLYDPGVAGPVLLVCGRGNNGGDGLVMARHLDLRGIPVRVACTCEPSAWVGDAATNYAIVRAAGIEMFEIMAEGGNARFATAVSEASWIVDALLGTGATGAPRPPLDTVIRQMNQSGKPIFAVDLPSGLDCDTGEAMDPTICARVTCTMVAAKPGLVLAGSKKYVGDLHVVDIGAPRILVAQLLIAP